MRRGTRILSHGTSHTRPNPSPNPAARNAAGNIIPDKYELAGKLGAKENATLAKQAEHLIKAYVGVTATVRVLEPGTIERSQGKAKRVIDRRAKS